MPGAFYREYYGLQFKHAHHIIRGDICGGVGVDKYDEELKSILPKTAWEDRMAAARKSSRTQTPETPVRPGGSRANVPESSGGTAADSRRRQSYHISPPGRQSSNIGGQRRTRQGGEPPRRTAPAPGSRPGSSGNRPKNVKRKKHKKSAMPATVIAAVLVLLIIIGSVFLITNYGRGSSINQKGLSLYADGSYDEAVSVFLQAIERDPQNAEYYNNLGMAYIAAGQYDEALAAFDNAAANTNRDSVLELAKRGSGIAYLSAGHYSKGVELFNEALTYAGDSYGETEMDILYYLAEAQERSGDALGAAETYTRIIELDEDADAYMLRGLAYQSAGDNASAEADLKTAISQSRKNYKTYLALYEVLMAQEKNDEAAQILDEALELGGRTGGDYSNRGIIYMYKGDYEGAAQAFNTALESGYNGAYLGLAESLMRQEDYEGAAAQYEAYLAQDTQNAEAYNQYGLCLMELSRYEDAQAAFAQGLALNDRLVDRELMYNEAITLEYMEDWTGAYEKMLAFVEKYPDDPQGQHELAFLERFQ